MVLQRAPQRAIVWGYTDDVDTPITLTMNNKVYQTMSSKTPVASGDTSIWSVTLDPQPEEGPYQVKVTRPLANGTMETITLDDVLFGDVWICSGQSNMQWALFKIFNASIEIENAYKYLSRLELRVNSDLLYKSELDYARSNSMYIYLSCW